MDKFKILSKLGEGGHGIVYMILDRSNYKKYAVKEIKNILKLELSEIDSMSRLIHPNITHIENIFISNGTLFILTNLEPTDLSKININDLNEQSKNQYIIDITNAVKFCHDNKIYHCDIKPHNILITNDNRLKLTDFGLSLYDINTSDYCPQSINYNPPNAAIHHGFEISEYTDKINRSASDCWALGCVIVYILSGKKLFESKYDIIDQYKMYLKDYTSYLTKYIDIKYLSSLDHLLNPDQNKRSLDKFIDEFGIREFMINGNFLPIIRTEIPSIINESIFELISKFIFAINDNLEYDKYVYIGTLDLFIRYANKIVYNNPKTIYLLCITCHWIMQKLIVPNAMGINDLVDVYNYTKKEFIDVFMKIIVDLNGFLYPDDLFLKIDHIKINNYMTYNEYKKIF